MAGSLKKTPLFDQHTALGGKLVPFAGYSLPVQYAGVVKEHEAVRKAAGLFDVSHMGELWFRGPGALEAVDRVVTNSASRLEVGRAQYTVAVNESGSILDDLIVYRPESDAVLVVVNAANREKMVAHFRKETAGRCDFSDASDETALIAIQGPKAEALLRAAGAPDEIAEYKAFSVGRIEIRGRPILIARTGYTGEDGFELFCGEQDAPALWERLLAVGEGDGLMAAGLGARDTLRLEACLCLYGNDIDENTNPYEAGLGWVVKLKRGDFLGRDALAEIKSQGPSRKLVGLEMKGRGIARAGYEIRNNNGDVVGKVTSGGPGPTVGKNIALGYVPSDLSEVGTTLRVDVRKKTAEAFVSPTPFYRRP